jgi:CsgH protein
MLTRVATTALAAAMRQALILLMVCCGLLPGASGAPRIQAAGLECAIRTKPNNGNFVWLEAAVKSDEPVKGEYRFSVSKQSSTGVGQNQQSGVFALTVGSEKVLATLVLDSSALEHYKASLSVDSDRGNVTCTSP